MSIDNMLHRSSIVKGKANEYPRIPYLFGIVSEYDLACDFEETSPGHISRTWRLKVPRIGDPALECAIYLYPSKDAAEQGQQVGASGCLIGVKSSVHNGKQHVYAVSNGHAIAQYPVIRVNTTDGKATVFDRSPEHWVLHRDKADVAACPINLEAFHRSRAVEAAALVREELLAKEVGIGDDVFMVGRFVRFDGKYTNTPAVRFGNISMLPEEPIAVQGVEDPQTAFLVEMRSLPGFSGSPVFVYRHVWNLIPATVEVRFLGIDLGHVSYPIEVDFVTAKGQRRPHSGFEALFHAGMSAIVPAWKIVELLDDPALRKLRKAVDDEFTKRNREAQVVPDASSGLHGKEFEAIVLHRYGDR